MAIGGILQTLTSFGVHGTCPFIAGLLGIMHTRFIVFENKVMFYFSLTGICTCLYYQGEAVRCWHPSASFSSVLFSTNI